MTTPRPRRSGGGAREPKRSEEEVRARGSRRASPADCSPGERRHPVRNLPPLDSSAMEPLRELLEIDHSEDRAEREVRCPGAARAGVNCKGSTSTRCSRATFSTRPALARSGRTRAGVSRSLHDVLRGTLRKREDGDPVR